MKLVLPAAELIILVFIVRQRVAQIIWHRLSQIYKLHVEQCNYIVPAVLVATYRIECQIWREENKFIDISKSIREVR